MMLMGRGRPALQRTGLRTRRHHQHHDSGAPGLMDRYETPDPLRSDAMKAPLASGSRPIVMINSS
jgi:hypothetical protein